MIPNTKTKRGEIVAVQQTKTTTGVNYKTTSQIEIRLAKVTSVSREGLALKVSMGPYLFITKVDHNRETVYTIPGRHQARASALYTSHPEVIYAMVAELKAEIDV